MADILVIHDQAHLRQLLLEQMRASGHRVSTAVDLDQARMSAAPMATDCSVVLIQVPAHERISTVIHSVKQAWSAAEVVVIGQSHDPTEAAEAVRHGAYDYLATPIEAHKLTSIFLRASDRRLQASDGRGRLAEGVSEDVASVDPAMQAVLAKADRAAAVNSTVLITGESGTGKEVLARRIHRLSARRHRTFVPVNCGGLPESLVETELFGHCKGAFTGAVADRKGLIEEARDGVFFLDEIGDMPLAIQGRLLRFLDSGEVRAVGGSSIRYVDVRIIAATNRSLPAEIREKRFREDLFFRLSVVWLRLPPLRDRRVDIPALVDADVRRTARKLGVPTPRVSDDALSLLLQYEWPGNIRELHNALEHALVQANDRVIRPRDLPLAVHGATTDTIAVTMSKSKYSDDHESLVSTLRRHRGNHAEAAAALGISRTTLWRRLKQHSASPA